MTRSWLQKYSLKWLLNLGVKEKVYKRLTTIDSSHLKHGNSWWATWGRARTNEKRKRKMKTKKFFFTSDVFLRLKNGFFLFTCHVRWSRRLHFKLAFKPQEQQQLVMLTTCNVEELEQRRKIKIIAEATNLDHMNMFLKLLKKQNVLLQWRQSIFFSNRAPSHFDLFLYLRRFMKIIINKK